MTQPSMPKVGNVNFETHSTCALCGGHLHETMHYQQTWDGTTLLTQMVGKTTKHTGSDECLNRLL